MVGDVLGESLSNDFLLVGRAIGEANDDEIAEAAASQRDCSVAVEADADLLGAARPRSKRVEA